MPTRRRTGRADAASDQDGLLLPAVAYVRMSTDHQKYSTENQLDRIRRFADERGFEILHIYEDSGRSGLRLDGREALQSLMAEVASNQANFVAILVYDVSRWGRFQDADEGAYHEHICSRAGIRVHYCGEQFENDGSIGSNLLKTVKRVMAGEYSRELSVKVFAGQCRLAELGFRQGGPAGYGLRRTLIDERHQPKSELSPGQRKSLQTDRVVLALGPPDEVDNVRRVYQLFVNEGKLEREIADHLNEEGLLTDLGRPWTRASIHQLLTNEKYVGNNVYNRVSYKLKQKRVVNTPEMWVRAQNVYPSVVDAALFERARAIVAARSDHFSNEELLDRLRNLLKEEGTLSGFIIDEREEMPSSSIYRYRFGSLLRAYTLVGYVPERDYHYIEINRELRRRHPEIVEEISKGIEQAGGSVARDQITDLLEVNGEFTVSVIVVRCCITPTGSLRWQLRLDAGLVPDITVAVRMDERNAVPFDYYLLPSLDMTDRKLRLAEQNPLALDAYRFDSLEFLYALTRRAYFMEAA